jgi:CDGSH-type Zn-finger protein
MTRIIEHAEASPIAVPKDSVPGSHIHICRCGLTRSAPLCDGTHRIARSEKPGSLVRYIKHGDDLVAEGVEVVPVGGVNHGA